MAGLLNLVPRYLPRYGMAPAGALAARPVVLVFAAVAFLVTWVFNADVDSRAGAYATGVLVLITSAAFAVMLSAYRRRDRMAWAYALITLVFAVTTMANMVERPDGLKIAGCFIAAIVINVIANEPNERDERNIRPNGRRSGRSTGSPKTSPRCSSRCRVADASEFEADLEIRVRSGSAARY
jgi:multisubunit Na+/H+ antiporter MnhB subunit